MSDAVAPKGPDARSAETNADQMAETKPVPVDPPATAVNPSNNTDSTTDAAVVVSKSVPERIGDLTTAPEQQTTHQVSHEIADSRFQRCDPRAVTVDRLLTILFTSVFIVVALVAFGVWGLFVWIDNQAGGLWILGLASITLIGIAALGGFSYVWSQWEYEQRTWQLDGQVLEIRRGVWWKHRVTIPRDRVQHTDVEQGPFMRQYGLAKLVLHTAGTSVPSIELPGLALATAESLRDQLTRSGYHISGVDQQ